MFKANWDYSESKIDQVREILRKNSMHIVSVSVATPNQDMKQSTDLVISIESGSIAVRIRRPGQRFRDLTIRSYANGSKTEIDKLRKGFGDWYLYAWENKYGELAEWMLVDINKMRKSGLLDKERKTTMNPDRRTGFIAYAIKELDGVGAIKARRGI